MITLLMMNHMDIITEVFEVIEVIEVIEVMEAMVPVELQHKKLKRYYVIKSELIDQ